MGYLFTIFFFTFSTLALVCARLFHCGFCRDDYFSFFSNGYIFRSFFFLFLFSPLLTRCLVDFHVLLLGFNRLLRGNVQLLLLSSVSLKCPSLFNISTSFKAIKIYVQLLCDMLCALVLFSSVPLNLFCVLGRTRAYCSSLYTSEKYVCFHRA